jgi:hypothetical protein
VVVCGSALTGAGALGRGGGSGAAGLAVCANEVTELIANIKVRVSPIERNRQLLVSIPVN